MFAIRKNIGFGQCRRAVNGVKHENFFVAKICDSESAASPSEAADDARRDFARMVSTKSDLRKALQYRHFLRH